MSCHIYARNFSAESMEENGDEGERRLPSKLPESVSDIEQQAFDGWPLPDFPAALF